MFLAFCRHQLSGTGFAQERLVDFLISVFKGHTAFARGGSSRILTKIGGRVGVPTADSSGGNGGLERTR
jgi:hypothetical protein